MAATHTALTWGIFSCCFSHDGSALFAAPDAPGQLGTPPLLRVPRRGQPASKASSAGACLLLSARCLHHRGDFFITASISRLQQHTCPREFAGCVRTAPQHLRQVVVCLNSRGSMTFFCWHGQSYWPCPDHDDDQTLPDANLTIKSCALHEQSMMSILRKTSQERFGEIFGTCWRRA